MVNNDLKHSGTASLSTLTRARPPLCARTLECGYKPQPFFKLTSSTLKKPIITKEFQMYTTKRKRGERGESRKRRKESTEDEVRGTSPGVERSRRGSAQVAEPRGRSSEFLGHSQTFQVKHQNPSPRLFRLIVGFLVCGGVKSPVHSLPPHESGETESSIKSAFAFPPSPCFPTFLPSKRVIHQPRACVRKCPFLAITIHHPIPTSEHAPPLPTRPTPATAHPHLLRLPLNHIRYNRIIRFRVLLQRFPLLQQMR